MNKDRFLYAMDDGSGGSEMTPNHQVLSPKMRQNIATTLGQEWVPPSEFVAQVAYLQTQYGDMELDPGFHLTIIRTAIEMAQEGNPQAPITQEKFAKVEAFWERVGIRPIGITNPTYHPFYFETPDFFFYQHDIRRTMNNE